MITAKEAFEIFLHSKTIENQLKEIEEMIKISAEGGSTCCYYGKYMTKIIKNILKEHGYIIKYRHIDYVIKWG